MLVLRLVVLFLNVLVAASVELEAASGELEPGWDPRTQKGPTIGGIYGILTVGDGDEHHYIYKLFVVIHKDGNQCRIVKMDGLHGPGARRAIYFFEFDPELGSDARSVLNSLYIFPLECYNVASDPNIMRKWQLHSTILSEQGVERLMAEADGYVNRWGGQQWPQQGGVYWVLPRDLGLKPVAGRYIPCVALYQVDGMNHVGGMYRVVRMDSLEAPGARPATEFLGNNAKLKMGAATMDLTPFHIFPRENHEIKISFMRLWNGHFIKISEENVERLMAASDGLVDGWIGPQDGPMVRGVYWMLPRVLGLSPIFRVYIPCVVIHRDGNKCRVVCMFTDRRLGGRRAAGFFGGNAKLEMHHRTIDFKHYYLFPDEVCEVEANPKIMQIWDGYFTEMPLKGVTALLRLTNRQSKHHRRETILA